MNKRTLEALKKENLIVEKIVSYSDYKNNYEGKELVQKGEYLADTKEIKIETVKFNYNNELLEHAISQRTIKITENSTREQRRDREYQGSIRMLATIETCKEKGGEMNQAILNIENQESIKGWEGAEYNNLLEILFNADEDKQVAGALEVIIPDEKTRRILKRRFSK